MKPPFRLPLKQVGSQIEEADGVLVVKNLLPIEARYICLCVNRFEEALGILRAIQPHAEQGESVSDDASLVATRLRAFFSSIKKEMEGSK